MQENSGEHEKSDSLWLRPLNIQAVVGLNTFCLSHPREEKVKFIINGKYLKHYYFLWNLVPHSKARIG